MLVYANICLMLLIVSENVELNPGPSKKCIKCETFVPNRTMTCVSVWTCIKKA